MLNIVHIQHMKLRVDYIFTFLKLIQYSMLIYSKF